ncbi:hypothetical protein WICMUC_004032 [Wickerhamomyces mucosus]|uniref:RNA polymerase II subunit B1 CTD phosphatase RPAP2 homolog n=1 Tax=Wickerhamomyces mucosus TaxID=1378264 RepID=A0A9P8PJL7_9ASCO|nr:hypothetical protein WICMUC_004032 [Wickerhamomyces mucosus]
MPKLTTISSFNNDILVHYHHLGTLTLQDANKLTLSIIEELSEDQCDRFLLKFITRFITKDIYDEVVKERNINKLCAYPLCGNEPNRIKDTYSYSYQKSKMLPYFYLNSFCSKDHYQSSEFYKTQLSDEAIFSRKDITVEGYGKMKYEINTTLLEEVIDKYVNRSDPSETMLDIIRDLESLSLDGENGPNKDEMMGVMSRMLEDVKIVEKEPTESVVAPYLPNENLEDNQTYEYLQDQSKAIDGYIFQR